MPRVDITHRQKFEQKKNEWLAEDTGFWGRQWDRVCFVWYAVPLFNFSWYGLPFLVGQTCLAASGPAIAYHTAGKIEIWPAIYLFLGILLLLLISSLVASLPKRRERRITGPMQTIWVRFGNLLNTIKSDATLAARKDDSIEFTLALACSLAAQVTGLKEKRFSASLLLYEGGDFKKMKVEHRDRGSERPIGRQVEDLETILGHIACQQDNRAPRIVADLKRFGPMAQKSPTQSRANYRSLYLQPVVSTQKQELRGFVSVDCLTPHAFHRRRADDFTALLEPLKAHIEDMI